MPSHTHAAHSMNAPVLVELAGETDPLEVRTQATRRVTKTHENTV